MFKSFFSSSGNTLIDRKEHHFQINCWPNKIHVTKLGYHVLFVLFLLFLLTNSSSNMLTVSSRLEKISTVFNLMTRHFGTIQFDLIGFLSPKVWASWKLVLHWYTTCFFLTVQWTHTFVMWSQPSFSLLHQTTIHQTR